MKLKYAPERAVISMVDIEVTNRYRKDYGDLKGMRETFAIVGQIQTIAVKKLPEGSVFKYRLLAGGRRYFALLEAKVMEVGVSIYPEEVDEKTMLLIEEIENVQRKEMDWKELAELHAAIDRHQKENKEEWSQDDTAEVLCSSQASVSRNIKLAEALKAIPELSNCGSQASAMNLIKRIEADATKKKIIESRKAKDKQSSRITRLSPQYIVQDVFEGMKSLGDGSFDLVEIDPPYGINYKNHAAAGQTLHYVDVEDADYEVFLNDLLKETWRCGKEHSWVLLWCAYGRLNQCQRILRKTGYHVPNIPITWSKMLGLAMPLNYNLASTSEVCIYARKGAPQLVRLGNPSVFTSLAPRYENRIHPTERPLPLMTELFNTFLNPGAMILSPFLGSGVAIEAADRCHMSCIGFDLSEENKNSFLLKIEDWTGYKGSDYEGMKALELLEDEGVEQ